MNSWLSCTFRCCVPIPIRNSKPYSPNSRHSPVPRPTSMRSCAALIADADLLDLLNRQAAAGQLQGFAVEAAGTSHSDTRSPRRVH